MPNCRQCGDFLGLSNWCISFKQRSNYLCSRCNSYNNREKTRLLNQKYKASILVGTNERSLKLEKHKQWRRKKVYNLTEIEYQLMLKKSKGKCGICGLHRRLVIDHDHKTGKVRGLLCAHCNGCLGWFEKLKEQATNWLDQIR